MHLPDTCASISPSMASVNVRYDDKECLGLGGSPSIQLA